jgi:hypothetical protein
MRWLKNTTKEGVSGSWDVNWRLLGVEMIFDRLGLKKGLFAAEQLKRSVTFEKHSGAFLYDMR